MGGGIVNIAFFFGMKVLVGLIVTVASAKLLEPGAFAYFTQLLLFTAWLNMVATGGSVNGVVREVAAARGDAEAVSRTILAALQIWGVIAAALLVLSVLLSNRLSQFLTGGDDATFVIPVLTAISSIAGLSQLCCAVLTARKRAPLSMRIQTLGLLLSGAGAGWFLMKDAKISAAVAFAAGPALTILISLPAVRHSLRPIRGRAAANWRTLLHHSAAFFAVASLPPLFLFVARSVYQETLSAEWLALWLLANRISDLNTQVVGIYNLQFSLPRFSAAQTRSELARVMGNSVLAIAGLSFPPLLLFLVFGNFLLDQLFPAAYLGAWPFIAGYLLGDVLRGLTSVNMMRALSHNRLVLYSAIELVVVGACSVAIAISAQFGWALGPAFIYPISYAAAVFVFGLSGSRIWKHAEELESRAA